MSSEKKRPLPGEGLPPPHLLGKRTTGDQINIQIDKETFNRQQEEINAQKREQAMKLQAQ